MKKCLLFFTMISLMALAINGCKKSKDPEPDNPYGLPNATQEGKNIFACRVNGENWIAEKKFGYFIEVVMRDTFLLIRGSKQDDEIERYTIRMNNESVESNRKYLLNDTLKRYAEFYATGSECFNANLGYGSVRSFAHEGELLLTKVDTIQKIVSGIFWLNILTDHCDTMKVTDGRFDIRY